MPGTRLAALIGESTDAQCYHHQAIAELGQGLIATARDPDGVVEAVEIPGEHFVMAVQWHPEERLDDLRLFAASSRPRPISRSSPERRPTDTTRERNTA